MTLLIIVSLCFLCSVVPAALFIANLKAFAPPPPATGRTSVAVLIPARNEVANIADCLACVLASRDVALEVLVLDDASTDATASIVTAIQQQDPRVGLVHSAALPPGWNGKQHACWQLAQVSTAPLMLFLDADVRIEPDAVARMAAFQAASGAALVSGFPRLITVGFMEQMLLPLIHFALLGFLPLARMRLSTDPAFAAGCGQFMLCERAAYVTSGGHAAIRATMHDGLRLPKAFRSAGFRTDLADITTLARVRMYATAREVWMGLAKNATEGIALPQRIVPVSLVLLLGQVVPVVVAAGWGLVLYVVVGGLHVRGGPWVTFVSSCATIAAALTLLCTFLPRLLAVRRFRQPLLSALLHPLGIILLLCVQWYALIRQVLGRPVGWRARAYTSAQGGEVR